MPSTDREDSRDRELVRHSHSFDSRMIPMWDSSDPDRAPPPLPLNPGSPNLTTRPNTSAAIMQAAKALEERARESLPASSYTTNPMPQKSPERSLIKGTQHKRMQSLQPGSVRDLRSYLDTRSPDRSPERSPERPSTRGGTPARDLDRDYFGREADSSPTRMTTPTPATRLEFKDTPALRPSHRSILGENTPPSATMMALQNMTIPPHMLDPPLSNVNNSSARSPPPAGQSLDSISTQLLSINTIVSSLQKDMSQLSRRSKDNATDLISLKEATNTRDEDIRKSLKDLLITMSQKQQAAAAAAAAQGDASRSSSLNLQDPHMTPTKQFTFPRMPSPSGWADERVGSPNPYSVEGAASVAMLEKIIREMVTKDGQERLIASLQKLVDKATGDTAKKVTELVEFVKQGSTGSTFVSPVAPGLASFQTPPGAGALTRTMSEAFSVNNAADSNKAYASPKAADFVSDEMLKFLRKIKDSVAESGCVTMATKTLVQDLRGEVLGMGRELARKVEAAEQSRSIEPGAGSDQANQEINAIVQEGLASLKEHMDKVMRDRRRQSVSSIVTRNTVDSTEVYDVVKQTLAERGLDQYSTQGASLDKEAIISAVREAYDNVEMKPNVEIQQFGLERDEILQCLREGLQDFNGSGAVTKEEIEEIIHDSLQQMRLPPPINEAHEIREEILMTVRECLEDLKPSLASNHASSDGMSKELLVSVIKEALIEHQPNLEVDIPPEAIYDAVLAGLESSRPQIEAQNGAVMQRLQALVDDMHSEFKAYSSANGRDTEQVLDALRDGLDNVRAEIQASTSQNRDLPQSEEIVDNIRAELEKLRENIEGYVAEGPRGDQAWNRGDMVSYIKSEFEHLHEELTSQFLPTAQDKEELLAAINTGFDEMKSQVALRDDAPESSEEINEAMKHEFDQLKEVLLGDTASNKNDVFEVLQAGFDGLHVLVGEKGSSSSSSEEVLLSIKEEFEHLRETLGGSLVRSGGETGQDDMIDAVREMIDGLRSSQDSASKANVALIQVELEALKDSFGNALVPTSGDEKTKLLEAVAAGLEDVKMSLKSAGVSDELLEAFRGELEHLRHSDGLTRQHSRADTEEVLEAVRLGLDDLRSHMEKKLDSPDRQMSATGEIIDAMNDGLEGLRADVTRLSDKPVDMTVSYEILDTLKEGLAALREDVAQLKFGTQDMGANANEDAPPTGNEVVLAEDLQHVQETSREVVEETTEEPVQETSQPHDIARMELILTQIQDKVEAMDANIQSPNLAPELVVPAGSAMKEDLAVIEELLKDVQAAVLVLQDREMPPPTLEGIARKEDTDAIETLLANTKAKIEEIILPDPETMVTKENLDDVELVVRTTSEALEALAKKIEDEGATKADVTVVQVIADDIKLALDEMKAAKPDDEDDPKATKADIDAVTLLVDDLKAKLDDLRIPNPDELPSKAEVEQLTGLIHDFRDSHDKLRDTYEEDIMKTARNFDDRKLEAEAAVESIAEVKTALDEMRAEIKSTLIEGSPLESLQESFKTLEETIGTNNVTADVKELMETVSREFERAHGSIEGLQNDHSEKSALHLEKHDEVKVAIIAGFTEQLDDKFNVLMAKYDDAQLLADEQARVMKEKSEEQEKILESTKTMADELRLTIDTLGASIAGMNDRVEEATTKWSTDSTTVFGKIDETMAKFEEQKLDEKTEHSHTRDEIKNVETIFTNLQDNITEYHPKFMVALREIEALVKAHYDHAQKTKEEHDEQTRTWNEEAQSRSEELHAHFANLPKLLPAPAPTIEPQEKYDDAPVQEKLDKLLAIEPTNTYDDAVVQEKLDKLLGHADEAGKAVNHLERLDEIHAQVKITAAEVSEFVAKQTQLITDGNESKEREADELALLIERRSTQKDQLEIDLESLRAEKAAQKERLDADIQAMKAEKEQVMQELKEEKERVMAELKEEKEQAMLEIKEEKDSLLVVVAALQVERENLANQKVRLTGEVSSLHTALEIRREELHFMDAKADALERRILNGIMDHSRALMMAKGGSKSPTKVKKRLGADVPNDDTKLMPPPSTAANGISLALKPRPAIRRNGQPANPAQRRILSLSQISGNAPTGAQAYPTSVPLMNTNSGLKRSHSVKTTNYARKGSWGGRPSGAVVNKENGPLHEEDETETEHNALATIPQSIIEEDRQSETGTERRYSIDSRSYAESYAEGETPGYDGRSSFGGTGSDYTYASGSSYMTGSDIDHDRRTSYGSTAARSAAHGEGEGEEDIDEDIEHSDAEQAEDDEPTATINPSEVSTATEGSEIVMPTHSEIDRAVEAVKAEMKDNFAAPSDSGVGTDLPTAAFGNESEIDADYFRRAAEEESTVG
ncbi:uncharacterized protein K460DRAFT_335101 [Cucurbitaria berberidis CBS 394.84]|uniref:Uncharacterized protein n=1 Tax=Cucurbitaria berberidis CBS 394.84 TaxID=1168544 RepID=A0A9P4GNJ1_9PLEO|nr:uncharacterized protein K460DRAFT_335101 [Cucurbitaria berberidis CBS 394.84]KAF1848699.1 hypothetical protein K460DRAFT_335101 [Cucurbitaria berberidis CBS 394.84]